MASSSQSQERSESSSSQHSARSLRDVAENAMSTDNLIDIIQRLGLVDMAVNRLRARLEATDIDSAIDDAVDYLRRNPEMIVVALGTLTVAVGAVVFLAAPSEEESRPSRSARSSRETRSESNRDDIDMTPSLSTPRAQTSRSRSTGSGSSASSRRSTRE
jgi:hypothetical protein